ELLGVVEALVHGVAQGRVLAKDVQLQLVGPPVPVGRPAASCALQRASREGALAPAVHIVALGTRGAGMCFVRHGDRPWIVGVAKLGLAGSLPPFISMTTHRTAGPPRRALSPDLRSHRVVPAAQGPRR